MTSQPIQAHVSTPTLLAQTPDPISSQILMKLGEMSVDIAVIKEGMKDLQDHEARIRKLEVWRYSLPTSLILAILSILLTVLTAGHIIVF